MKEPVTIIIPVFSLPLTAVAMNSLSTVQEHLGDFPITFIKSEKLTQIEELTEFCPTADFVSFDDRYFSTRTGYTKLLLTPELYQNFGWSRYLLICEMNTVITKNELAYWCRQGYDFIQLFPDFLANSSVLVSIRKRFSRQDFLKKHYAGLDKFRKSCGISLRNVEAFQKLTKRKQRSIHRYLASATDLENDAIFWEFHTNRWWPEINTPTALSRKRFAQSANFVAASAGSSESAFAISGLTKPVPAPNDL